MKVVFITGKQGSGKSYTANELVTSNHAKCLDIDKVLNSGGKRYLTAERREPTDWELWKELSEHDDLLPVLRTAIAKTHGSLVGTCNNLIVDGAILCNTWFLDPFIEAMTSALKLGDFSRDFVYVNASNQLILDNVIHRASRDRRRQRELERFPNAEAVGDYHGGFDRAIAGDPKWNAHQTKEAAVEAVRQILAC